VPLEFRIDGLDDLRRSLSAIRAIGGDPRIKKIAEEGARVLHRSMVDRAPYNPRRKRGTHLRDAIFIGLGPPEYANVLVGVNIRKAPHAWLVEYGSRIWSGKPYFRPAIELLGDYVMGMIQQKLQQLLEQQWEGKNG
jgi:hypothetical protein